MHPDAKNDLPCSPPVIGVGGGGPGQRGGRARKRPSALFLPPWQLERAARIHKLLLALEKKLARGRTINQALKYPSWFHRRRGFRSRPGKPFPASVVNLIRLYYLWKKNGRTPDALVIHYRARRILVPPGVARRFLRAVSAPGITSFCAGYRALPAAIRRRFKRDTLIRTIPGGTRAALQQLYRSRVAARHGLHQVRVIALRAETDFGRKFLTPP